MDSIFEVISRPWPWYVSGPLIGLTVPLLLVIGHKWFGISSSLRHICAACVPAKIPFFSYEWRKEKWNLFFVVGVLVGGTISQTFLANPDPVVINEELKTELVEYGVSDFGALVPTELFSFANLFTIQGFVLMVVGGFLVGFGTRYAGGCTSGHSITGISMLQPASMLATFCFMIGGIVVANFVLPSLLAL